MEIFEINNNKVDILRDDPNEMIMKELNSKISKDRDGAFYICDLGDVVQKFRKWHTLLPRVEPFYAVKCNDDLTIVSTLAQLGTGFDCASKIEMQKVLGLNVAPDRIVYANPCKQLSHIRYAAKTNVQLMTFDNESELQKIKNAFPNAKLVLRILPPEDTKCQYYLGNKFGVHPQNATKLLQRAKELSLNVVGVSFHVGSGCYDANAFSLAVVAARTVFNEGKHLGFNFDLLDIGGGFPGQASAKITFEEGSIQGLSKFPLPELYTTSTFHLICDVLRPALDFHFPESMQVKIIAEPGRYFVASALTLAVNVIGKRKVPRDIHIDENKDHTCTADDEPMFMYYVNDGLYGSFNCSLYETFEASLLNPEQYKGQPRYTSSIWGPTCDGLDCITEKTELPELYDGDWLVFQDMGAYTMSLATNFNGMAKPACYFIIQQKDWANFVAQSNAFKGSLCRNLPCAASTTTSTSNGCDLPI